jgi:hypothetical protein
MNRQFRNKLLMAGAALGLAIFGVGNRHSLREGLFYLRQWLAWQPGRVKRIDPGGDLGLCYDLVGLANAARYELIVRWLYSLNLAPTLIPIPDEPLPNVLVLLGRRGPYTLFVAHYDKSRETPAYQAASDNTAAVAVLLAAIRNLVSLPQQGAVGFLFTGAEEKGLKGAESFVGWAGVQGLPIANVINLDMLGRGKLACRPSALPGFYFWLPGWGEMVYDGRQVRRGGPYPMPDPHLIAWLKAMLGDELVVYQRFTARSDSNLFQKAGWPTLSLSSDNMYYLNLVWDRDTDRLELLDEDHLNLVRRLVVRIGAPGTNHL